MVGCGGAPHAAALAGHGNRHVPGVGVPGIHHPSPALECFHEARPAATCACGGGHTHGGVCIHRHAFVGAIRFKLKHFRFEGSVGPGSQENNCFVAHDVNALTGGSSAGPILQLYASAIIQTTGRSQTLGQQQTRANYVKLCQDSNTIELCTSPWMLLITQGMH